MYSAAMMNRPTSASSAQIPWVLKFSVKLVIVTSVEESTAEQEALPVIQKQAAACDSVESLIKAALRSLGSGR